MKNLSFKLKAVLACLLIPTMLSAKSYNVAQLGGVADGKTVSTAIIQKAIDDCSANGGGTVVLDGGGSFVAGTIYMKSFVTLRIESGTTLLAVPDIEQFGTDTHKNMYKNEPHMDRAFIFARDAENFSFEGSGTINGNGAWKNFNKMRPMMMRFVNCKDIRMNDLHLVDPAAWTSAWLYCDDISVSGISIRSRVNQNGDGLDFDGCTNVRVTNSAFDTSDDCICLQTSRADKPCQDVVISNCNFVSKWAGIRIGLLSGSTISSVAVSNCTFRDIQDSGLKIQQNEGGEMKNMVFSNLVMENVPRPVFMTFCQQRACTDSPEELAPLKSMGGFLFQNILVDNRAVDENAGFVFTGMPNHMIEDVALRDVHMVISGGGTTEQAERNNLPEMTPEIMKGWWPEYSLFGGALPSCGLFVRHTKNFIVDNFVVKKLSPDARPIIRTINAPNFEANGVKEL